MKSIKLALLALMIVLSSTVFSQKRICRADILNGEELKPTNLLNDFNTSDFSALWLSTDASNVYGVLGDEHQRILVKLLTAKKNPKNLNEYEITGKTSVKGNICDFTGKITIDTIQETKRKSFGVDDEAKERVKNQGLLIGRYEFFEDKTQKHVGIFKGIVKSKWFIDQNGKMNYDNINAHSDGYFNNAFVGNWILYNSTDAKICNWGDFRVPNANCNFDIGAGEISVSEKYANNGWLDTVLKNQVKKTNIITTNEKTKADWWK